MNEEGMVNEDYLFLLQSNKLHCEKLTLKRFIFFSQQISQYNTKPIISHTFNAKKKLQKKSLQR